MPRFNAEYFIARRIAATRGESKSVMVTAATATIVVSIAVMVLSMSVIAGFRHGITSKLEGFGAHVEVASLMNNNSLETYPIEISPLLEQRISALDGFRRMNTFAIKGGVFKTDEAIQGVMLKGVDERYDWHFFADALTDGELPRIMPVDSPRVKDLLISRRLADAMKTGVGDKVEILFVQGDAAPRRDRFKVSGIYDSGMGELDKMVTLTDVRNVQRLNGWADDQVTGYEVVIDDFSRSDEFAVQVDRILRSDQFRDQALFASSLEARYMSLFDWLKTHDVNGLVVIVIMIVVAVMNMICALLIMLFERMRMIGVLKAMGMTNRSLRKVFVIRSAMIVLKGMALGNVIGIGIGMMQEYLHLIRLDKSNYFLSEVPVRFEWAQLGWLNLGVFVAIVVAMLIPTMIISGVKPEKTIRYQ